ncbi:MAG: ABC transporter ATP-binding protein [Bacteroidetes bacterium]|nr:ABC transporter ATP-binding protein [Bacteroidota bacterium]
MIEIKNLKKHFNGREALKGISLSIKDGEFYGLLGPNGAGKTTTISILSSILNADSGTVSIENFNLNAQSKDIKKIIGVVPQEIALYNELSALDNLLFWGGMYNISNKNLLNRANELLRLFGLEDRKNDKVKSYSGGMKRRVNIAAALLHNPKVLFMDEPTVGIDPQSRNLIFEIVEKLNKEGMTIVYTTHYMEEAEKLCDRIGIIDNGQIIAEGTLDDLKMNSLLKETISITFSNLNDVLTKELSSFWNDLKQIGNIIHFYSSDVKTDLSKLVLKCNQLGLEISNIEILKTNLETIFLNLTGKQLRD